MQRGAMKRDREPFDKTPDYVGAPPAMRAEDRAYLGLTDEAFEKLASTLKIKILGYANAGFRKPADVSRLLNKEKIRTLAGTEWNPRLAHFLLGKVYGNRPRGIKAPQEPKVFPDQNKFDAVRNAVRRKNGAAPLPNFDNPSKAASPKKDASKTKESEKPAKRIKVRAPEPHVPLSPDEMTRRLVALKRHFEGL